MANDVLVQIGVTAMRTPSGDFLPSQAMYIKVPQKVLPKDGVPAAEAAACTDIAGLLVAVHREYMKLLKKEV